jgi:hypothetical protein
MKRWRVWAALGLAVVLAGAAVTLGAGGANAAITGTLADSGFETTVGTDWNTTDGNCSITLGQSTTAHEGTYSGSGQSSSATGCDAYFTNRVGVTINATGAYTVTAWVRRQAGTGSNYYANRSLYIAANSNTGVGWGGDSGESSTTWGSLTPNAWVEVSATVTVTSSSNTNLHLRLQLGGDAATLWDDVRLCAGSSACAPTTTTTTGGSGGAGSTCGGTGQPACAVNLTSDSGGFFSGLTGVLGSSLSGLGSVITSAVSGAVSSIGSMLTPSSGTAGEMGAMAGTLASKAPFSILWEVVTLVPDFLDGVADGIDAGPPSSCPAYLCGTHSAFELVTSQPAVTVLRNAFLAALAVSFAYALYRSVGDAVNH